MVEKGGEVLRYERKFLALGLDLAEAESCIMRNPAFFSPVHHEREINNIYLDSPALQFSYTAVTVQKTRQSRSTRPHR